jgi:cell division protein FtsL
MTAPELLQDLLPTKWSRGSALITLAASPIAWAIPHLASPFWPSSTQALIVLAQLSLSLLVALLGTIVTFGFVLSHQRTLVAKASIADLLATKQEIAMTTLRLENDTLKTREITDAIAPESISAHLTDDQERILILVSEHEPVTAESIRSKVGMGAQIVLHHLEFMRDRKLVREYFRDQSWRLQSDGRGYLVNRKLIS